MKAALTGGGTAGHVMVGSVLIPMLEQEGFRTIYIGSAAGAEKQVIEKQGLAAYHGIPTGKLRRYISLQNLIDPFRIIGGMIKAFRILKKEAPHVIFSGGGYVSVPVVLAARLLSIPILLRETDMTVGLANRICLSAASAVNVTFPDTAAQIRAVPVSDHGMIVRPALLQPSSHPFVFARQKPVLLVMGGSMGAAAINSAIRDHLQFLLSHFNIIHLCGAHNTESAYDNLEGYVQFAFWEDMAAAYGAADYVLTRCGSNAICEGLVLGKKLLCVPLTKSGSRGEQYDNARFAVKNGTAVIVDEGELGGKRILDAVKELNRKTENNSLALTPAQLRHNCVKQIEQLYELGMEKLHRDFMKHIRDGKQIDFSGLNEGELCYFLELAEYYGS